MSDYFPVGSLPTVLAIGERVETHPATDAWMQGDRYGEVVSIGRKYVHVKLDRSGRTLCWRASHLRRVTL